MALEAPGSLHPRRSGAAYVTGSRVSSTEPVQFTGDLVVVAIPEMALFVESPKRLNAAVWQGAHDVRASNWHDSQLFSDLRYPAGVGEHSVEGQDELPRRPGIVQGPSSATP